MEEQLRLYMVLLGCTPQGRLTEQHDIFFGIGASLRELIPDMHAFWHDGGELHIDCWREVTRVGDFNISIVPKAHGTHAAENLFFLNLGGYRPGEFEEYHYKTLIAAPTMAEAVKEAKQAAFYKHCGFKGAASHIDDKYGIDVDDLHKVEDILPHSFKERYSIALTKNDKGTDDELHIGYLKMGKLKISDL